MKRLLIISASVREQRRSHGVALYLHDYAQRSGLAVSSVFDLKEANFPLFSERLAYLQDAPAAATLFSEAVTQADAVIIVSPEYNISVPAATKNAIDLLTSEWQGKSIGIASVSSGGFGARNVWGELSKIMLHIGARPSSMGYFTPNVQNSYNEFGLNVADSKPYDERAHKFITSLLG